LKNFQRPHGSRAVRKARRFFVVVLPSLSPTVRGDCRHTDGSMAGGGGHGHRGLHPLAAQNDCVWFHSAPRGPRWLGGKLASSGSNFPAGSPPSPPSSEPKTGGRRRVPVITTVLDAFFQVHRGNYGLGGVRQRTGRTQSKVERSVGSPYWFPSLTVEGLLGWATLPSGWLLHGVHRQRSGWPRCRENPGNIELFVGTRAHRSNLPETQPQGWHRLLSESRPL